MSEKQVADIKKALDDLASTSDRQAADKLIDIRKHIEELLDVMLTDAFASIDDA